MSNVFDIAAYITNYQEVDNLKLQKLLFYTQAVSLVRFKKIAFSAVIEAWDYGPVVPEVYKKIKKYKQPIKMAPPEDQLETHIIRSIDMVLKFYGEMSGLELMTMTHTEKPWIDAYKKGRNSEITNKAIKAYYKTVYTFVKNE